MRTLAFLLLFLAVGSAHAASFDDLARVCRTNWNQYSAQLNTLQATVTSDVSKMSREQVEDRIDANDPLMLFVKMVWPEILEGKDDFWRLGKECADLHRNFRADMTAGRASRGDLQNLKDCVADKLSRKTPAPFKQIFGCYDSLVR